MLGIAEVVRDSGWNDLTLTLQVLFVLLVAVLLANWIYQAARHDR